MQNDSVIWQIIRFNGCKYRKRRKPDAFCANPYNALGFCCRTYCPLANSRYATIREFKGICYLMMKTIERAHLPAQLWEKIPLSRNFGEALNLINEELEHWPRKWRTICKKRLTKIHQYLIRMRKLKLQDRPKMVPIKKKYLRREKKNEKKALKASNIRQVIKDQLLKRLESKTYGNLYNFPQKEYEEPLDIEEIKEEKEINAEEIKEEEAEENKEQEEEEENADDDFVADYGSSSEEDDDLYNEEAEEELDQFLQNNPFEDDGGDDDDYGFSGESEDYSDPDALNLDYKDEDDEPSDEDDEGPKMKIDPSRLARIARGTKRRRLGKNSYATSSPTKQSKKNKRPRRKRIEVEYEQEKEAPIPVLN